MSPPTLDRLRRTVLDTGVGDWHVIERGPLGPYRLVAIHRADVRVRLACGIDVDEPLADGRRIHYEFATWADAGSDTRLFADLLWNGTLVDRSVVFWVDAGRAVLPWPCPVFDTDRDDPLVGYRVSADDIRLARLIHGLARRPGDFDAYLKSCGFDVTPAESEVDREQCDGNDSHA